MLLINDHETLYAPQHRTPASNRNEDNSQVYGMKVDEYNTEKQTAAKKTDSRNYSISNTPTHATHTHRHTPCSLRFAAADSPVMVD